MPIKKREHKNSKINEKHNAYTISSGKQNGWAIIASTIMMIIAYPIGIYTITGWVLTLAKTGIEFGSQTHAIIGAAIVIITALFGLFGTKISAPHKIALLAIFASIPFGFYKIIKTFLNGQTPYYNELAAGFGIIFFLMIIIVFKKNTD